MGSAKAWYFAALGVVALSLGSSGGRCLFDKATIAVEQLRARTMPYVAMLEMTLSQPQNALQVQQSMARVQETVAQAQAQRACAEAAVARIQAAHSRMEARKAALQDAAAAREQAIQDQVMAVPDGDWVRFSSFPDQSALAQEVVLANHALARVQAWKASRHFGSPNVMVTPNEVTIDGPVGKVFAPRPKVDVKIPCLPARPGDEMRDPI